MLEAGGKWAGRRWTERGLPARFQMIPYHLGLTTYLTQFRPGFFSLPVTGGGGGRGEGALEGPFSISSKQLMLQSYGHQNYTVQCTYHLRILGIT